MTLGYVCTVKLHGAFGVANLDSKSLQRNGPKQLKEPKKLSCCILLGSRNKPRYQNTLHTMLQIPILR